MTFLGPLLIVYVVWGSTYLAQKVGLETLPPLTMNATRFLVAGALLYAYCRWRRMPNPDRPQWRAGAIQGLLLPAAGTGGAAWAEQYLSSGITALFLATIPLWIVLGRRVADHEKITWPVALGLLAGFTGVVVLARPSGGGDAVAIAVALGGALCWGLGTVYAGHAPRPQSALMASAIEMLCAGAILVVLSGLTGEWSRIGLSGRSALAVGYLIVFGSLVAYTAYTWLLDHAAPRIVGTYAFVNPVVAVLLGWWILSEPLTLRTLLATGVIAAGVALIVLAPPPQPRAVSDPPRIRLRAVGIRRQCERG
ncbi:EamA family transporter [Actinoplanes sp. Pm04-4]|uniref:EamA family transporter n=1 Tax=Paractinoplanes pyxinae TaxID=2997416 RepID=A0ABT4BG40_9ACTN|nr:EamA family transporter [Actinoplanes pyxinae]MCY1145511.1 EamA family transporter [Actinoplanes pyxinae]